MEIRSEFDGLFFWNILIFSSLPSGIRALGSSFYYRSTFQGKLMFDHINKHQKFVISLQNWSRDLKKKN